MCRHRLYLSLLYLLSIFVPYTEVYAQNGLIIREFWNNVSGKLVSDLKGSPNYPHSPSGSEVVAIFEGPTNSNENYGSRMYGYLCPPVTGNYTFWISGDDECELLLSTDQSSSNATVIARVPGWTSSREWTKYTEQKSGSVYLTTGKTYFIEAIHKEATSGDNLAVGWQLPDGTFERPIPGARLSLPNEDLSLWKYSKIVRFNTTSSGASISQNAMEFPLLIRLDSTNFNFSQAQGDGSDIRFTKSSGALLPYEIELWDSIGQSAAIWVKLDTVFANCDTQHIKMFYGKKGAPRISCSSFVYTSQSLVGKFHLNQNPAAISPQMLDLSPAQNHGTVEGTKNSSHSVSGIIGKALYLANADEYISSSKSFANVNTFTIALWFKTTSSSGGKLIGFGNVKCGLSSNYDRHVWMDNTGRLSFGVFPGQTRVVTSASTYNDGNWHHVVARLSPAGQYLFVDGLLSSSNTGVTTAQDYNGYWKIGFDNLGGWNPNPSSTHFTGVIDEVQILHNADSDSKIKLYYENQRLNSGFITFLTSDTRPAVSIRTIKTSISEGYLSDTLFEINAVVNGPQSNESILRIRLNIAGTALNGIDFNPIASSILLTIPKDSAKGRAIINFVPIEDRIDEGNETVRIRLLPDTMYSISGGDSAVISIIDNDRIYPPVITEELQDKRVLEGDMVNFSVNTQGSEPFTYKWYKNEQIIPGISTQSYVTPPVGIIDNNSNLSCIITNSAGADTSRTALLQVIARPLVPRFVMQPLSQTISEGDSVKLFVKIEGTRPVTYQWYTDTGLVDSKIDSFFTTASVTIRDNGRRFYCIATNAAGSATSASALITVKRPTSNTIVITGDLFDYSGTAVGFQGEKQIDFYVRLYPTLSGDSAVYTETFTAEFKQSITVRDGKFVVRLGEGKSEQNLREIVRMHPNLYVSFSVTNPNGNPELLEPRTPLTAAPYALSGTPEILRGTIDPKTVQLEAPVGTHFVNTNTSKTYIKTHNSWVELK